MKPLKAALAAAHNDGVAAGIGAAVTSLRFAAGELTKAKHAESATALLIVADQLAPLAVKDDPITTTGEKVSQADLDRWTGGA